ncbi:MAG: hypothetical protein RMJ56_14790 [Gemmataceae bacterium]|nr:hypothetical protein [Gemmata sp.]MDW8198862.1 hypothetical protein [Gemmataceae bacterium]
MAATAHDRLCAWLELPPGSWPPDHYTLLGLPPGCGEFAAIEERVMERMERLRPHQLMHPELVTEGMNRLAQALVCLTDREARAAYDRSLGLATLAVDQGDDEAEVYVAEEVTERTLSEPAEIPRGEKAETPTNRLPPTPQPESTLDTFGPSPPLRAANEWAETTQLSKNITVKTISRRAIYRRLATVRRALRAWEALRPFLGTPGETLATPVAVFTFLQALKLARAAVPGVARLIGEPGRPGSVVAALVRSSHPVHLVRLLVPSQRQSVARDWQRGYDELQRAYVRLRTMAVAARPRPATYELLPLLRAVRQSPEWLLVLAALVALALALVRNA